ncbi:MAG: two-component regulator propeller domain-containing protein [Candidatus Neomarinimicrobiota bacterium]
MNNYLYNMFHLLFFTIVTLSNNLVADEVINFRHLTVENDGLSESTVYDVFQDSRGYVWICTDNGLNKYDGYSMDSYQYMHYDTSSISKGAPRYIFEDQKGYVWISTNAGFLNKLDLETEKVKRILPIENPMFSSLTFLNEVMVNQLPDGRIICPVGGFLVLMDENGKKLEKYKAVQDSIFKKEFYDDLSFIIKNETALSTILNPGNQVDITEDLIIDSEDSVIVVLMGEYELSNKNGQYDYGWIEDLEGNKVWSPWDEDTTHANYAGGSIDNRLTVQKILLDKGSYKLRFVSDLYHSFNSWSLMPPDYKEFWGIGVYENKLKKNLNRDKVYSTKEFKWNPVDIEINQDGTMWMSNKSGMVILLHQKLKLLKLMLNVSI